MAQTFSLTLSEIPEKLAAGYLLIDIRDAESTAYGMIPDAISIPYSELNIHKEKLLSAPGVILYCGKGPTSEEAAEELRELGINALWLEGGYLGWLMDHVQTQAAQTDQADIQASIESGLRKTWHRRLFSPFAKACKTYDLIQEGDKIAVCISGGKDSMLMAKLFQELQKHRKVNFELLFLVMDPGYSPANRTVIEHNAKMLGIPVHIFETPIFDAVFDIEKSPCYICARMRRGYLYSKARELGCNKIALGHHYDDVIETILMGMLYGGQIQTMMPKLHSTNFEGMELIRPMYLIRESDIKKWRDANDLTFIQCACKFTENCATCEPDGRTMSKRLEIKNLIASLKATNPEIESHIFRSVENVCLDTVVAYKIKGTKHSFLDTYND